MSIEEVSSVGSTYAHAIGLSNRGYLGFPLIYGSKAPATRNGFKDATADPAQIEKWFDGTSVNLGIATGHQPNGINLVAVDVDRPKDGGDGEMTADGLETMRGLIAQHGQPSSPPTHRTPRGGFHMLFDAGELEIHNSSHKAGPLAGIDVRGIGGYIAAPPSIWYHPLTGELIGPYRTAHAGGIWGPEKLPPIWPWLVEYLTDVETERRRDVYVSQQRHPSQANDDHPATWLRNNFDVAAELHADGFALVQVLANGDQHWLRSGGSSTHSLTVHENGSIIVWSGNCPEWMFKCGWPAKNGFWTINAFTYYAGKYHNGDVGAAMSHIRRELMPPPDAAGRVPAEAGAEPSAVALEVPQLPESFWQRPVLAHIRQAAWHYLASPDATLLHVMTRFATTVHPKWMLPMKGTLDVYGVVISPSGAGKGQANKAGRGLWPGPTRSRLIAMDQTPSSGEGLIEAFMGAQDKVTGERPVVGQAAHFIVDEGTTLIAQLGRDGATIIGTLCSAWVGEALGQLLSDRNRSRYIPPLTVRVCSTINIQNELAGQLYSDILKATGFTGRCTFVCGQDPNMPDVPVDDPGPLKLMDWSAPPTYSGVLSYPPEVHAAVREEILAGHRGTLDRDPRQSHRILQRVKWSMILAMMDGRQEMSLEDWALGGDLLTLSASVLAMLDAQHATTAKQQSFAKLQTRAEAEAFVDDTKATHVVRRVERWVLSHIPKGDGIGFKALRRKTDGPSRMAYDEAVDNLVREGKVLRSADDVLTLP